MNTREAMQALLEGKKIKHGTGFGEGYLFLTPKGNLATDFGVLVDFPSGNELAKFELYEEPNPHTVGTFAWAREEANRGKQVRREAWESGERIGKSYFFPFAVFQVQSIDATDWKVVS